MYRSLPVALTLVVSLFSIGAQADPPSDAKKCRFAYVYLNDEPAAVKFQQLLAENNSDADLVTLDAVTTTEWAKYSAVIVGSDTEKAWSTAAAKAISDAKVPVLGLGEGGYYFFGKLNLGIGSPNGYHGAEVGVRAAESSKEPYWTSAKLKQTDSEEQILYSSSSHVGIYLSTLSPGEIPLGYELNNKSYAPIMEQDGRYLLWGFTASPEKMTPLGKRMFVHTCRYVARAGRVERETDNRKSAPASQSQFAFVYLNDNESTKSFKELLTSNGLTVDLVAIEDVPTTDFASYKAVIAGPDIERAWSNRAANTIATSEKPVLGLGEGGSALFEKLHLDIGWMHTYHGGEVGVRVVSPTNSTYWTSADPNLNESDEQLLYSSTGHVAVFLSELSPGVVPLSYELKNKSYAPIIEQDRRYLLWGFRESPLKMTPLGKQLFVHTCRYVASELGSEGQTDDAAVTSSVSNSYPQVSLSRRVKLLEAKVAALEGSRQALGTAKAVGVDETVRELAVDPTSNPLQGVWVNVMGRENGVPKVVISKGDTGWTARAFGACEPTDCDWGATKLHLLGDSVASQTFTYGFARWDHGFAEGNATLVLDDQQLVLDLYKIFKDKSGRSNFRSIARFRREDSEGKSKPSNGSDHSAKSQGPGPDPSKAAGVQLQSAGSVINLTRPLDGIDAVAADESLALYFTFGPVGGGGTLVQVNWDGTLRSSLELPYSISGLAPDRNRLLATVGSSRVGEGRVIAIGNNGLLTDVLRDRDLLPDTTGIWSTVETDEILVADNGADVVVSLAKDGKAPARKLIQIEGHRDFQSMSVARCPDGSLLYSGSDFKAVYRVAAEEGPTLRNPLLQGQAAVCADPNSTKWVAAMANELHVFDANQHITSFSYPEGRSMRRSNIQFSNKGQLILGLKAGKQLWVYAVDIDRGEFHGLFRLRADRVTGFAIASKMDW